MSGVPVCHEGISRRRSEVNSFPYLNRLGVKAEDTLALIEKVEAGFPFYTFERLQDALEITSKLLAELVQINPRTLTRRKAEGKLQPDESERLLRAARIFEKAVALFEGDEKAARIWLTASNKALGGKTPLSFAKTDIGAREVENLIGRLEHGVYA